MQFLLICCALSVIGLCNATFILPNFKPLSQQLIDYVNRPKFTT